MATNRNISLANDSEMPPFANVTMTDDDPPVAKTYPKTEGVTDNSVKQSINETTDYYRNWINKRTVDNPTMQEIYDSQKKSKLAELNNFSVKQLPYDQYHKQNPNTVGVTHYKSNSAVNDFNSFLYDTVFRSADEKHEVLKKQSEDKRYLEDGSEYQNNLKAEMAVNNLEYAKAQAIFDKYKRPQDTSQEVVIAHPMSRYDEFTNNDNKRETIPHEISHVLDSEGSNISKEELDIIKSNIINKDNLPDTYKVDGEYGWRYFSNPSEVKARINAVRLLLNLQPDVKYDNKNLPFDELKDIHHDGLQDLIKMTTPEKFYNLLNQTSSINNNKYKDIG